MMKRIAVFSFTLLLFIGCSKKQATEPSPLSEIASYAVVKIVPPELDDLWFYENSEEVISSSVTDTSGNVIEPKRLMWNSSQQANLRHGAELPVRMLRLGNHHLELVVTFQDESTLSDTLGPIRIVEDPYGDTDLLNDRQLITLEDPNAAGVNPEWKDWIEENHEVIRSLTSNDFQDLEFLQDVLSGREIVQLGENGHGVKEFNQMKVRLIEYLHQEMGFDVIAFESSLFDCYYAYSRGETFSPMDLMQRSIYGVWHTDEVLRLFEYIQETRNTDRPLFLAGFDMKTSAWWSIMQRPEFLKNIVSRVDTKYAEEVYDLNKIMIYQDFDEFFAYLKQHQDDLTAQYQQLLDFLDANTIHLEQGSQREIDDYRIARRAIWSILKEIPYLIAITEYQYLEAHLLRDGSMADNLDFLRDTVYPGRKIVVWAHNFHICHHREVMFGGDRMNAVLAGPAMGTWVVERHRSALYTLGFAMYRGSTAYNTGSTYVIRTPGENGLEAILYQTRKKFCFVDMIHQEYQPGTAWMFQQIVMLFAGLDDLYLVPRSQFDGWLFVDTVHPPDYVQ